MNGLYEQCEHWTECPHCGTHLTRCPRPAAYILTERAGEKRYARPTPRCDEHVGDHMTHNAVVWKLTDIAL